MSSERKMHTDTAENPDELRKDKEEEETEEERVFGSRALLVPWLTGHVCLHSSQQNAPHWCAG